MMANIKEYHAHIYFDETSYHQAKQLCNNASNIFPLSVGHFHKRPVGPHPCWSCQLAFSPTIFGNVVPWLALNRNGLTVFIHPETGDNLKDHTEHAIWMGKIEKLDLLFFNQSEL